MNTDEPTKDFAEEPTEALPVNKAPDTQPMLTEILERVNVIAESLASFRDEARLEFRKIGKQLEMLNNDLLRARTDQRLLEDRVGDLERKAS